MPRCCRLLKIATASMIPPPSARSSRLRYLRVTPFDAGSEEGRADERYRLAAWGALANIGSRAAALLLMVLTVYWAAPYLGQERFGVWATFASLAAALSFLDLGVGNALISRVAHAVATGDQTVLRRVVAGGVGWLALIAIAAAALAALAALTVPWRELFKLSTPEAGDEARTAAIAFGGMFGLHLFSSGLAKILIGQQRSHESHLLAAVGALLACFAVYFATRGQSSIAGLLLASFGVPSLVGLVALVLLRSRDVFRSADVAAGMRSERTTLLKSGTLFLILQIGTMVGWGSDSLLLAGLAGAGEVAAFAVAQRLFQLASQPVAVLNAPLWVAYADATARGDRAFVRSTLRRSAWMSVTAGGVLSLALLAVAPSVVPHWTQGSITVPWILLALLAAWTVIEVAGTAFGIYLNGVGVVREQVLVVLAFCATALPLKVAASLQYGAPGLVAATIGTYLLTVVGLYASVFRRAVLRPLVEPPA